MGQKYGLSELIGGRRKVHGEIHQKKVLTMLRLSSPNMSSFEIDQSREQSEGSHHSIVINNRVGQALKSVKNVQKAASSLLCEGVPAHGGDHFEDLETVKPFGAQEATEVQLLRQPTSSPTQPPRDKKKTQKSVNQKPKGRR